MFFRQKRSGDNTYLQIVENHWNDGRVSQRVVANLGRLDKLLQSGELESLIKSGVRFCDGQIDCTSAPHNERYLSPTQIADVLQVSSAKVFRWLNDGELPGAKTRSGRRRVKTGELRRFLEAKGLPVPGELHPVQKRKRIFVVDDDVHVLRAIKRAFAVHGGAYDIDGCHDGVEALILIGALQPDLILLDIYMDWPDGFEVCRRLMKTPRLSHLRIVAITASPSEDARARILDYGALDYWVKPVKPEQVISFFQRDSHRSGDVAGAH